MPEFFQRMSRKGMSRGYAKGATGRAKEEMAARVKGIDRPSMDWETLVDRLAKSGQGMKIPVGYRPTGVSVFASKSEVMQIIQSRARAKIGEMASTGTVNLAPSPMTSAIVRSKVPAHDAVIAGSVASASRKARFHKAHTEGKIRASINAHRPGQRHTGPTGTIIL